MSLESAARLIDQQHAPFVIAGNVEEPQPIERSLAIVDVAVDSGTHHQDPDLTSETIL